MSYISGARSVPDEQVRIASTKIYGIGPKKAFLVCYQLGISGNIKIKELTKYQIDQMEQMIGQDHVVHWRDHRGAAFCKKMRGKQIMKMSDKRNLLSFLCRAILLTLLLFLGYIISTRVDFFQSVFEKSLLLLGGNLLSLLIGGRGPWFSCVVRFALRALLDTEAAPPSFGNAMFPGAGASGGELIPYSSPANSSSEDSFDLQVLLEPWPVTHNLPTHNLPFESSMINRIFHLENENSIFLLDKERGVYWSEIKNSLDGCSSQREYNRLLEFENRDLQIRELKHQSFSLFQEIYTDNPALFENSPYSNPEEAIMAYFGTVREEIDTEDILLSPAERDRVEIKIYAKIIEDIIRNGPESYYIKKILGHF